MQLSSTILQGIIKVYFTKCYYAYIKLYKHKFNFINQSRARMNPSRACQNLHDVVMTTTTRMHFAAIFVMQICVTSQKKIKC